MNGRIAVWSVLFSALVASRAHAANVTLDQSTTYQVMRGYGAASWTPPQLTAALRDELLAEAVNELGLNRLRFEPPGGNSWISKRWEWLNDDGDPLSTTWSAFNTAAFDKRVSEVLIPFKKQVEARGEPFDVYVSPSLFNGGSSGEAPAWLRYSPGEFAEYAATLLLRLRDTHGITADWFVILNEAGNNNPFTAAVVASMIKAVGPRLEALGLSTQIQFPECVNANTSWNYINSTKADAEMWSYVGLVSYHLYGGNSARPNILTHASSLGLPTAQTEYMGLTTTHLYEDMTQGGVSYWEIYGLGSCFDLSSPTSLVRKGWYWPFRQLMHYVRPGFTRIKATSDDANLRPLAFAKGADVVVVLINDLDGTTRTVSLSGLPSGSYGLSQSVAKGVCKELGLQTVAAAGTLAINVPGNSVVTLYRHPGGNQPPTVTGWSAAPTYLTAPASTVTLSASATDPEAAQVTFQWSVGSQPAGAAAVLASPTAASTKASGLTKAGDYRFDLSVSDGQSTVKREVRVPVHSGNQPPIPIDVHNRIPVVITLPSSQTTLRGGGWDLENDPLTFKWSVVSQPAGASAQLGAPTATSCPVTGMTVAGDYTFKLEVSDPTHTVPATLTVPVYPVNSAPVISSASASPASLTLPTSSTSLSASVSDPDGDTVSHWWSVKSSPAGTHPGFSDPGAASTKVSGLIAPGSYVLNLVVVDRAGHASKDVTVTVAAGGGPLLYLVSPNGGETYIGGQKAKIRWTSAGLTGNVKLELFDGASWSTIAASTADDGVEPWTVPSINATGCKVRVTAVGGTPADESDGTFSISGTPVPPAGDGPHDAGTGDGAPPVSEQGIPGHDGPTSGDGGAGGDDGCSCSTGARPAPGWGLLGLLALVALAWRCRRRRSHCRRQGPLRL